MANQSPVFISYSHKDEIFLHQLLTHLRPYHSSNVSHWSDKQILPGAKWFAEIKAALKVARVAVLLVTKDFLASEFVREHELGPLLKSAEEGGVRILWVLVRACSYQKTPLKDYQALISPPAKPLAEMKAERDGAWVKICTEIQKALELPELSRQVTVEIGATRHDFDVVADFSMDSNPVGAWSYGYSLTLGGHLILHSIKQIDVLPGVDRWASPLVSPCIGVMRNRTGAAVAGPERTYAALPDMLHMHPGYGGIYDVVRWTCPRTGAYSIQGEFCGLDVQTAIADTDVHILINSGRSLFGPTPILRGIGTKAPIAFNPVRLLAGEALDFSVGVGPSGSDGADSTGLRATIKLLL